MSDSPDDYRPAPSGALTMEEAASLAPPRAATPQEALRLLVEGNTRFYSGASRGAQTGAFERRQQISAQTPFAALVGCSDSRVPLEIVFDQGLGDLFAIRVAGNVVEASTAGSVEYAVAHLDVRLVVVMGHEGCGAVKAAMLPDEAIANEPEGVRHLLAHIRPAVEGVPHLHDRKARLREAVVRNVQRQRDAMAANATVAAAVAEGRLAVVGAYYELSSGAVDFYLPGDDA